MTYLYCVFMASGLSVAVALLHRAEDLKEAQRERTRPWERQNYGKLIFLSSVFSIMLRTKDISHTRSILGYLLFPHVIAAAVFNLGWHQSFPLTKSPLTTLTILDKGLKYHTVSLYNPQYPRYKMVCDFRFKML